MSPFDWLKKGSCQLLVKESVQGIGLDKSE